VDRSDIERVLKSTGAIQDLKSLVAAGCSRDDLLVALQLAFLADESWKEQVGMDLRQFQRCITEIGHCAKIVDRLNRSKLIYRASIELRIPGFVDLLHSPTLSEQLREYALKLDRLRLLLGPKRKIGVHVWKAWIVAMVTEATRSPHHREASAIIGAALGINYSEVAHRAWRLKHAEWIEMMRPKLPKHRRSSVPAIPPPPSDSTT